MKFMKSQNPEKGHKIMFSAHYNELIGAFCFEFQSFVEIKRMQKNSGVTSCWKRVNTKSFVLMWGFFL